MEPIRAAKMGRTAYQGSPGTRFANISTAYLWPVTSVGRTIMATSFVNRFWWLVETLMVPVWLIQEFIMEYWKQDDMVHNKRNKIGYEISQERR